MRVCEDLLHILRSQDLEEGLNSFVNPPIEISLEGLNFGAALYHTYQTLMMTYLHSHNFTKATDLEAAYETDMLVCADEESD